MARPGDPNYGVNPNNQTPKEKPIDPKSLPNKPDWNSFMHPDRVPRIAPKPKPSEFQTQQPPINEEPRKPLKRQKKSDVS